MRREALTNPRGPAPVDESFAEQLAPDTTTAEAGGHADESRSAADDKRLHETLPGLDADNLAQRATMEPGTRLEQGGVD